MSQKLINFFRTNFSIIFIFIILFLIFLQTCSQQRNLSIFKNYTVKKLDSLELNIQELQLNLYEISYEMKILNQNLLLYNQEKKNQSQLDSLKQTFINRMQNLSSQISDLKQKIKNQN